MIKKNQVKIFLSQEEAQALIMASYNMKSDLNKLKNKNQLAVGWRIIWEDLENGIEKASEQYHQQVVNVGQQDE